MSRTIMTERKATRKAAVPATSTYQVTQPTEPNESHFVGKVVAEVVNSSLSKYFINAHRHACIYVCPNGAVEVHTMWGKYAVRQYSLTKLEHAVLYADLIEAAPGVAFTEPATNRLGVHRAAWRAILEVSQALSGAGPEPAPIPPMPPAPNMRDYYPVGNVAILKAVAA